MYVDDYDNGDMISVYGIYFCGNCKNMMKPLGSTENVNIL